MRQLNAHHAIHEGGLTGAKDKTEEFERLFALGETEAAVLAAEHLLDYWETRILSHADAEEEGFYQEMEAKRPELAQSVVQLARDHDLLRIMVKDLRTMLAEEGLTEELIHHFHALVVVNAIHSREEERLLFN